MKIVRIDFKDPHYRIITDSGSEDIILSLTSIKILAKSNTGNRMNKALQMIAEQWPEDFI